MIDFKNASVFKLTPDRKVNSKLVDGILVTGEDIVQSYTTVRDKVFFTNKRIIAVNIQGIGMKKDFTSLPYSKVQAFSVETAGSFDLEAELDLWFSSVGMIRFEFLAGSDVRQLNRVISEYVLNRT
ncbi:MAG: PH domain-containing protein [Butyricicoccus sp.]